MKPSDYRISKSKEKGDLLIVIKAYYDASKHSLLFAWISLWTVCGLYISTEYFRTDDSDLKLFLIAWTAFWIYFEYKVIHAFRWRKWGREELKLSEDKLTLLRIIGKRGLPQHYKIEAIKNLRVIEVNKRNFFYAMNASYWTVAGERLAFDYNGKTIVFGMEIGDKEAKYLCKDLQSAISERTSS